MKATFTYKQRQKCQKLSFLTSLKNKPRLVLSALEEAGNQCFNPRESGLLQETLGRVARSTKTLTLLMTKLCELRTGFLLEILRLQTKVTKKLKYAMTCQTFSSEKSTMCLHVEKTIGRGFCSYLKKKTFSSIGLT